MSSTTLGTPHQGSPVTNMMCATYKEPDFYNAKAGGLLSNDLVTVGYIFEMLNFTMPITEEPFPVRWYEDGGNPGASEPDESKIVPSLQIIAYSSEVLEQLNLEYPFNDDISYASIVGHNDELYTIWGLELDFLNCFRISEPFYNESVFPVIIGNTRSYFPWSNFLEGGDEQSDAIVPTWSQTLPARFQFRNEHHLSYTSSLEVQDDVFHWLQDSDLPKGDLHRAEFLQTAPNIPHRQSRNNAYAGSSFTPYEGYSGAGVKSNAIARVTFSGNEKEFDEKADPPELGKHGGVVTVTCTGMNNNTVRTLTIEGIGMDSGLFISGKLRENILIPPSGGNYLNSFIKVGYIGRGGTADSKYELVGPDGIYSTIMGLFSNLYYVAYKVSGSEYGGFKLESPGSSIKFASFELDKPDGEPIVPSPPAEGQYFLRGGVLATGYGSSSQNVTVYLKDRDLLFPDTLVKKTFSFLSPNGSFDGVVIPYETDVYLFINEAGEIAGIDGSSGETSVEIYQELEEPGLNPSSGILSIGTE